MLAQLKNKLTNFCQDDTGATAIEYSLIAGLIFLAIVGGIRSVATSQNQNYDVINTAVDDAINSAGSGTP